MEVEIKVNPLVKFLILKMLVGSLLAIGPAPEFAYLGDEFKRLQQILHLQAAFRAK